MSKKVVSYATGYSKTTCAMLKIITFFSNSKELDKFSLDSNLNSIKKLTEFAALEATSTAFGVNVAVLAELLTHCFVCTESLSLGFAFALAEKNWKIRLYCSQWV